MSSSQATHSVDRTLPSSLDSQHALIQEVVDKLADFGWSQHDLFGVRMALEETITNAIRHGNRLDPARKVQVECKLSPEFFWARIRDEGPGFCPEEVPDCCADENLEAPGGRGLALIRGFMSKVEYNKQGNTVTLEKRRELQSDEPSHS